MPYPEVNFPMKHIIKRVALSLTLLATIFTGAFAAEPAHQFFEHLTSLFAY